MASPAASPPATAPSEPATHADDAGPGAPADAPIKLSSRFRHASDDEPEAPPTPDPSQASYWRDLAAQAHAAWHMPPGITNERQAAGCIHISPDGRVVAVKRDGSSGDAAVDASVEHALADVQRARNEHPVVVPTDQLSVIKRWVCFAFRP